MFKKTKTNYGKVGAYMVAGMVAAQAGDAHAQAAATAGNNFSTIAANMTTSIQDLPGLLAALSYLFGILLGVLGVMKVKDHVENPTQTPLKDGAIRLAAGGGLFALPIMFEAMLETLDASSGSAGADAAKLKKVKFTTI